MEQRVKTLCAKKIDARYALRADRKSHHNRMDFQSSLSLVSSTVRWVRVPNGLWEGFSATYYICSDKCKRIRIAHSIPARPALAVEKSEQRGRSCTVGLISVNPSIPGSLVGIPGHA